MLVLVESWEILLDNLIIIFIFKEGLCWFDGKFFIVDDVLFFYNDFYLNFKIFNNYWDSLKVGES